jgi:peptidoglycan hydrolase-like protein with peptidoglycan-binding domain
MPDRIGSRARRRTKTPGDDSGRPRSIARVAAVTAAAATAAGLLLVIPGTAAAQEDSLHLSDCGLMVEGQSGDTCIALLQLSLNATGAPYGLTTDGDFGPSTRTAVLDFQGRSGLAADGNAGPEVVAALVTQVGDHDAGELTDAGPPPPVPAEQGPVQNGIPLAQQCAPERFASFEDYVSGRVGPPRCFPYQPRIEDTAAGRRALDPFNDGCSGPTPYDRIPLVYDFRDACATHDYAYDLLRYGVDTFREPDADNRLYRDWLADCSGRLPPASEQCRVVASEWRVGVRFGNVDPGGHITDR